jgi:predicted transcriptional regulator
MRRNDLDICADVLRAANGGAKKTHLVYQANLNFNIVKKYLRRLLDNGLLEVVDDRFFTTEKGHQFLEDYGELVVPLKSELMGATA